MLSGRAILSVQYTAVSAKAVKSVGGFLSYVQHRDHSNEGERERGLAGLVRYVAYRDAASPDRRLFDRTGTVGSQARQRLVAYVRRSSTDVRLTSAGRPRAVYRFVLSPEDARGLDLRRLAGAVMSQLELDTGPGGVPPWIAAEHRNTAHPHVHIVLAARREVAPGRFRELRVTKQRLANMKLALAREIELQRTPRSLSERLEARLLAAARPTPERARRLTGPELRRRLGRGPQAQGHRPRIARRRLRLDRVFQRMAAQYKREAEREARRWQRERGQEREMEWEW
ncbi:MAG TPA: hypothetical protein VF157_12125 [Chloroflexota bacterium]